MKTTIFLPLMLCCVVAAAQDNTISQTLPELQEWYSIKGSIFNTGAKVSYLPGFDSLGGGMNAITQHINGKDIVWYNRFPFDTTAQFQWKSGGAFDVYQLDANGDGIPDYFDTKGRVYRGRKGQKPESEPAIILSRGGTQNPLIGDLNNDGYDDLLAYNDPDYFDVILGNRELSAMTRTTVEFPTKNHHYVGGYFSEQGKPRIILFHTTVSDETFTIYDVIITNTGNQPKVTLEYLHQISEFKNNGENVYDPYRGYLYWNKRTGQNYLMLTKTVKPGENKVTRVGYTIANDKLIFVKEKSLGGNLWSYLECSVDGDENEDFIITSIIKENNQEQEVLAIYTGLSINNPTAVAFCRRSYCGLDDWVSCIGDVNKDGIGDIAYGGSDGCFSVYLGLDWRKVGVNDIAEFNSFKIHQNIPNPVHKDRKTLLPVSLNTSGKYSLTLYDVQGNTIKELFVGELSEGDHKIPLDLMGLSAGMYVVKMSNGSVSRERAIMIGE